MAEIRALRLAQKRQSIPVAEEDTAAAVCEDGPFPPIGRPPSSAQHGVVLALLMNHCVALSGAGL